MERIVEEFVTDLVETSSSCSFKWRINNISTASPKKDFLIKSKEFYFYDANAKWYVKIGQFVYNANQKYLGVTFMLSDDGKDENARYKFSIKLESGLVMESQFISKNKTSKGATLEYQMGQFIPLESGCESIELEPTVIFETLTIDTKPNYPQETVEEEIPVETNADESIDDGAKVAEAIAAQALVTDDEDEFDTLVDLKGIVVPEIVVTKEGEASTERTDFSISTESDFKGTSSESEDIDDSDSEYDVFEAVQDDKSRADYKMSNLELTKQIRKIYMQKMKQIADTSSRLLVTAARNNFSELLSESCHSFAAQLTCQNFSEIWKIACELQAEELKRAVVTYIVSNRDRINYDLRMTSTIAPDLMLEVVRAIEK